MICPHCRAENADQALRCAGCGVAFSVLDDSETLGPGTPYTPPPEPARQTSESGSPGSSSSPGASWPSATGFPSLEPGSDLGERYRIESMLGEGGMGAVYKAYDRELDRVVALKLLRPGLMTDASALQRFKQELLLASKVSHKNILRIHDLGDVSGLKFISMAFVEGDDLHGVLRKSGRLPIDRAVEITRQLCGALEAAHAEGVVHRDLKPHNVLLDAAGNAYVSDFGLAKSLEAGAVGMTRAGEFLGTPRYMSPEQVEGGKLDHRSDLYSLGLILYEMVTGEVPFTSDSTLALMYQRVKQKPKDPRKLAPDIPDYLARIILRCLEKDPEKRYQNAREILNALDEPRTGASRTGVRSGSVQITLQVPTTRKWQVILGAAALLLAGSLAVPQVRHFLFGGGASEEAAGQKPVTLLIADFKNTTGDSLFDGTLEPAFQVAVEGASFISCYNRVDARKRAEQLQAGTAGLDESAARLVAVREGIPVVVLGTIRGQGDGYRLKVDVLDAVKGSEISSFEADAAKKDVLAAVGKLAAKVRTGLGDSTPESMQLAAAETYTAASLEAAQQYAQAQQFQWAGKWDDAIERYRKAIELDPDMGRAYAGLAAVYSNTGRMTEAENYYKQAFSKIDRMSEREKFRTRGAYYLVFRNTDQAVEELRELVQKFPFDSAGRANLALAYFFRRDMTQALEEARKSVELNPKSVPQRNNLGLYAMYAGDFETATREQRAVLEMNPSFVRAYAGIALPQLAQGQVEQATETYRQMEKLSPWGASMAALGLADVALYEGRAMDAIAILEKGIPEDLKNKDTDGAATKLAVLGEAYALAGQAGKAAAAADRAVSASRSESILYWAAHTYIALSSEAKAERIAEELGRRLEPEPQATAKLIEAEVLLKRGKGPEALKVLQESRKLADSWLARLNSGRAYLEAGAFAEASSEFDACLKRRGEATAAFLDEVPTARLLPTVHYYLGRAQEGLGSAGAAESYKAFLAAKKNGAEDPLVADARRRLANR